MIIHDLETLKNIPIVVVIEHVNVLLYQHHHCHAQCVQGIKGYRATYKRHVPGNSQNHVHMKIMSGMVRS
jgi:hypothetical protein